MRWRVGKRGILCWISSKVDADATDSVMGLNENEQEPGGIKKDSNATDYQEPK